jgi:GAF domain-containing protein
VAQREALLAQTFVDMADTLVADFDVLDFLTVLTTRCVELFDLSQAGLMLANLRREVAVAASSSHEMEVLELFELQHQEGPCLDCFHTGQPVRCDDLERALARWPRFAPEALAAGFRSVYALPLRLRDQVIGALNLLRAQPGVFGADDLVAAQALADVATIGILQHRAADEYRLLAEQLQYALNSRIVIEQAKGVLAEHAGVDMDGAFAALRRYARDNNRRLVDTAAAVVAGTLPPETVCRPPTPRPDR